MARRARGHYSMPPTASFTPGIVEHGETMVITRRTFVVPDEAPRPIGKRTMTVGRKTYSWTPDRKLTDDDYRRMRGRTTTVTESLNDDDDGTAPMPVRLSDGTMGYAQGKNVVRTVDMNDAPLPGIHHGPLQKPTRAPRQRNVKPSAASRVPRQASPRSGRKAANDALIRSTLKALGVKGNVTITREIRELALDAAASRQQRKTYLEAAS